MSYVQHTHSGHINETKFHLFFCGWFGWNKRRLHKQYQMGKRIRLSLNTNRILVLRRVYSNTILLRLLRLQFNTININNSTSDHVLSDAHPSPVLPHCLVTTAVCKPGTRYLVPGTKYWYVFISRSHHFLRCACPPLVLLKESDHKFIARTGRHILRGWLHVCIIRTSLVHFIRTLALSYACAYTRSCLRKDIRFILECHLLYIVGRQA